MVQIRFECETCKTIVPYANESWRAHASTNRDCVACGTKTLHKNLDHGGGTAPAPAPVAAPAPPAGGADGSMAMAMELERLKDGLTREDWENNGPLRQAYQDLERQMFSAQMIKSMGASAPG
eukprot:NODE_1556_length_603_cov_89.402527_g1131_i0.p1 GENE.NODE_1556_length_603_cov_89.402527_g1131_i0~~NODE_1556_length_603_cov_89.402527_g1131_i0.p1  ORF type:complete len:122 (+),score=23.97 NODE_1556_length_603_cov_89.402527_g1131_i0:71-436(+)